MENVAFLIICNGDWIADRKGLGINWQLFLVISMKFVHQRKYISGISLPSLSMKTM
jgi:hypothetical protein